MRLISISMFALCAIASSLCLPSRAVGEDWNSRKCALFYDAWSSAQKMRGTDGLSAAFLDGHVEFFASECRQNRPGICPQSPQEWDRANMLTLMIVAEGATGSFLPYHCPAD